jgi:hypothetical protein
MPFEPQDLRRCLISKLHFDVETVGRQDDHTHFIRRVGNLIPVRTKISYGRKEIGDGLQSAIATELCVSMRFLDELVGCRRSVDEWEAAIRQKRPGRRGSDG